MVDLEKRRSPGEPQSRRGKIENFAATQHPALETEFRDIAIDAVIKVLETPREKLRDLAYDADREVVWKMNPYGLDMIRKIGEENGPLQQLSTNAQVTIHEIDYKRFQKIFIRRLALIETVRELENPSNYEENKNFKDVSKFLDDVLSSPDIDARFNLKV